MTGRPLLICTRFPHNSSSSYTLPGECVSFELFHGSNEFGLEGLIQFFLNPRAQRLSPSRARSSAGKNLNSHLSNLVNTLGFAMRNRRTATVLDSVLLSNS